MHCKLQIYIVKAPVSGPTWSLAGGWSRPRGQGPRTQASHSRPSSPGCCRPTARTVGRRKPQHVKCIYMRDIRSRRKSDAHLHTATVLINVGQRDAVIISLRLLHQEGLLPLTLLQIVFCGWWHYQHLDFCEAQPAWRQREVEISTILIHFLFWGPIRWPLLTPAYHWGARAPAACRCCRCHSSAPAPAWSWWRSRPGSPLWWGSSPWWLEPPGWPADTDKWASQAGFLICATSL